jgi:GTPase
MRIPVVAIVGRPNVGKSTYFNRILRRRQAVVDDTPGVTRDRNSGLADHSDKSFYLVDTGGWYPGATEGMEGHIAEQVNAALSECDAVLFMVDTRDGVSGLDEEISQKLHQLPANVPVIVLVNKVDSDRWEDHALEFASLGWEHMFPVSSIEGRGVADSLDCLLEQFPESGGTKEAGEGIKVAIIGRPNVGKSSLTNRLLGEDRVIVDEKPGTTRDSIDVPWIWHKRTFWLIDTAGLQHQWEHLPGFEFYSALRSIRALERADVALLMFDTTAKLSRQDQRVASIVQESGKPCILLFNKWDAIEKDSYTLHHKEIEYRESLTFLDYAPSLFISALTAQRINHIPQKIIDIYEKGQFRVSTADVNKTLSKAIEKTPPRGRRGKKAPKILYGTQLKSLPPTFGLFARHPEGISKEYIRYLGRQFREDYDFEGSPIRFWMRTTTGQTAARGKKKVD